MFLTRSNRGSNPAQARVFSAQKMKLNQLTGLKAMMKGVEGRDARGRQPRAPRRQGGAGRRNGADQDAKMGVELASESA